MSDEGVVREILNGFDEIDKSVIKESRTVKGMLDYAIKQLSANQLDILQGKIADAIKTGQLSVDTSVGEFQEDLPLPKWRSSKSRIPPKPRKAKKRDKNRLIAGMTS